MARAHIAFGASLIVIAIAGATPAFAQDTTATSAPAQSVDCSQTNLTPQQAESCRTGATTSEEQSPVDTGQTVNTGGTPPASQEIVVTGSRIARPRNLTSLEPTITLTNDYLQDRGLTNVADAINELPGIRGSVTPAGAQGSFGQGVNFINIANLGSNRTLTLVDGRRFVSSNVTSLFNDASYGTQVDLNAIPSILVDRVEIESIGGAPVYGSDAIAGTINIFLKNRYKGLTASLTSGVTDEGDNFRYNASILGGMDFSGGRGNVTLSYSRDEVNGVLYNARDYLRQNLGNVTNPTPAQAAGLGNPPGTSPANDGRIEPGIGYNTGPSDNVPGSITIRDLTIYYLTRGGLITYADNGAAYLGNVVQHYQFDRNGNLVPFNTGIKFPSIYASGGDGFRFSDYSQVTSQLTRDTFNAFVHYDFTPALKFFAEGEYFHSRADQLVTQPTFNSNLFGGTSGPVSFDVDNPFLTNQARTQLMALGVQSFDVSRASSDLADTSGFNQTDLYHAVVGLRGDFEIGGRSFNYEATADYGRVESNDTSEDLNAQHFINAVNVARDASGNIVCTTAQTTNGSASGYAAPGGTPVADPACVPLNLFGEGVSSPAARAYVIDRHTTHSVLEEQVYNVNVGGSPFDLFGNAAQFNVGYEHRLEKGSFTPSQFEQQGLGRAVPIAPLSGDYNIDAVFGEVDVPVVTADNGLSFLNRLEIYGRGRYVDNTVNGGFFAWAAGGQIAPTRDIMFRGNYTRSFRSPAIVELFLPVSNAFDFVPDLCSPANINAGPAPATRKRNCDAFLAAFPNATPLDAAAASVPSQSGGNPNLDNEIADSYTFGAVFTPRFLPGLSITADWLHINIKNPISNLSVDQIASACFDNPDFNTADPANGNAFCSQIERYPVGAPGAAANGGSIAGQVINDPANPGVKSGFVNGQRILYRGIQGTLDYTTSLSGIGLPGRFNIHGELTYLAKRLDDITGVAPVRTDGTIGDPTFTGQLNLGWRGDSVGLFSSFDYVGEQLFSRVSRGPDIREFDKLDDFIVVNPSLYIDVNKQFRFNFSVTNLLNRRGQRVNGYLIPASYSDLLGRRYSVNVQMKF